MSILKTQFSFTKRKISSKDLSKRPFKMSASASGRLLSQAYGERQRNPYISKDIRKKNRSNQWNWNEWEEQHGHVILTCSTGRQSRPEELMYTMPLRDTVAGEALSMLWGSKMILHWGDMGIRSPLARVSVLLSSRTLLRFSIQIASTGPSNTIQMRSPKEYKESINQSIKGNR